MKTVIVKNIIEDMLATIVLYNTSPEQSITFQTLSKALAHAPNPLEVLIYDNSPTKMYTGEIYDPWNIHYHHEPDNRGISGAFNWALALAKKLDKKWLLLLDQDTAFPTNTFKIYAKAIENGKMNLFAPRLVSRGKIISPFKAHNGEGKMLPKVDPRKYQFNKIMPVNSGLIVNVESFETCGGYNEAFPLDYSDFAFIERYKKINPEFEVIDLTCEHQFSGIIPSEKGSSIIRFAHFCDATKKYKLEIDPRLNVSKVILKRALRLSVMFRSTTFLKTAFTTLFRN